MRTRHGPLATFRRNLAFRHLSGSEKSDNGAERSTVRNDQKRERERGGRWKKGCPARGGVLRAASGQRSNVRYGRNENFSGTGPVKL
jgi:hypothetical protein